jgi:hypothetical protein
MCSHTCPVVVLLGKNSLQSPGEPLSFGVEVHLSGIGGFRSPLEWWGERALINELIFQLFV